MHTVLTTNYAKHTRRHYTQYVHKYYLPVALRQHLNLGDLAAIDYCLQLHSLGLKLEKGLPEPMPEVIINYCQTFGFAKRISPEMVREAALALQNHREDYRARPNAEEIAIALAFNRRLIDLEEKVLLECLSRTGEMRQRMKAGDPFLSEFEIDVRFNFYVREDDPFYDNDEANRHDADRDASLICIINNEDGKLMAEEAAGPDYWGFGDNKEHGEGVYMPGHDFWATERQCYLFHEFHNHRDIPLKHLGRIGLIWTDIQVWHQNYDEI